jgi:lysophospholipase L1-like esterase
VDEVRILASAEKVPALLREGLPWIAVDRTPPFPGAFVPADHEVIAVTGGEDAFAALTSGQLSAHLMAAFPKTPLHLRNLAWEGDTVHEQWRIHNFGSWERQLARAGATAVLAWFGKNECLAGRDGVPAFKAAYAKLLDLWASRTRRVVLVSPAPFESLPAPLSAEARNADLALYAAAIRELAAERGALFVDLSGPFPAGVTRDGVHLNDPGLRLASSRLAAALAGRTVDATPRLVELAREQNRAWMGYWRPDNWAFLNGDRATQPSSRDHEDRRIRWFPGEVQSFLSLVRAREREIRAFLEGAPR